MHYNVLDISRYIINYAHKTGQSISNLKLQKILYYVQAAFLIYTGDVCFDDMILCWRHGPVIKRAYNEFSKYSSGEIPIQSSYNKVAVVNGRLSLKKETFSEDFLSQEHKELINDVSNGLLPYGPWYLVDRTHEEDPWKNLEYYNEEITTDSIRKYFQNHQERLHGEFNQ